MSETRPVDAPNPRRTDDGRVVLDWWCDLACPDCADSVETLDALRDRVGDVLEIRLRHFPLTDHVWAVAAAQCQEEARSQGRGEEYAVHALAAVHDIEGPADYVELAEHLGLDADAMAEALFDGRHAATVSTDQAEGRAVGVTAVPTYVLDGVLLDVSGDGTAGLDELEAVVRRARKG